jgi:hypothetical protein
VRFTSKLCAAFATTGLALGLAAIPAHADAAVRITCSVPALKSAIVAANATGGTIFLSPGCVYRLTNTDNDANGLPVITGDVRIVGNLAAIERVEGSPLFRIFEVGGSGRLSFSALALRNGDLDAVADGGAVLVDSGGALSVRASTISGNSARNGGGIFTFGSTSVDASIIRNNTATGFGGGIGVGAPSGSLSIDASSVTGNRANFSGGLGFDLGTTGSIRATSITNNIANINGGGVANDGTLTIRASRFSGNRAGGDGGGLANDRTVTVSDSVFNNNTANRGGGVANFSATGQATINSSLISFNNAQTTAGGIFNSVGTTTLNNTLVIANRPNNCLGSAPSVQGCVG